MLSLRRKNNTPRIILLFLLTVFLAAVGNSGATVRPHTFAENRAAIPAPQQISHVVSTSDCAIPLFFCIYLRNSKKSTTFVVGNPV